jgi:hypothetical protein
VASLCVVLLLFLFTNANADESPVDTLVVQPNLAEATALLELEHRGRKGFEYSADSFVVYGQNDSLFLYGAAKVIHKGVELGAAEMVYRRQMEMVEARSSADSSGVPVGKPTLTRGKDTLRGSRIIYSMESERATILDGRIQRDEAYYAGQVINTLSSEEFHVNQGSYTTCDYPEPHFDFYSPRIKVLSGDMAIAKSVFVRVNKKPVFWIPFYVFSLRENRQSGLLTPSFGRRPILGSSEQEWEIRNLGYYLAPNDYMDMTVAGDLRTSSGWLASMNLAYAVRYLLNGQFQTRLENRHTGGTTKWSWWTNVRHSQEVGENAQVRAAGTFQSNKNFARNNSFNLNDRLDRTLRSNASFSKRWRGSGNSLSVNASHTERLDSDRFDTVLPEVSLRKARKPIWDHHEPGNSRGSRGAGAPWYSRVFYDGGARMKNSRFRRSNNAETETQTSADLNLNISSQQKPFQWLQIAPRLSETWSDRDVRDDSLRSVRRDRFDTSARITQTFYGMFFPQIGPLTTIRHVVKPSIAFRYQATHTDTAGVLGINGRGSPWKQNRPINFSLDNTFWVKLQRGEEESKVRLAQLNMSISYDVDRDPQPLSELRSSLSLAAGRTLDSRLTLRSEFYDNRDRLDLLNPRLRQLELRTSLRVTRKGISSRTEADGRRETDYTSPATGMYGPRAGAFGPSDSFGYERGLQSDVRRRDNATRLQASHYISRTHRRMALPVTRSWVRISASWSWLRRWNLQYSVNYNLHDPEQPLFAEERITSELLSIQREFHDWSASFNFEPSSFHRERTFYLKAQLKDIPQIKLERGDRRF